MSKGGMQSSGVKILFCRCGKPTSRIILIDNKEISIHFSRKGTYWHIHENGAIKRTFKKPEQWD